MPSLLRATCAPFALCAVPAAAQTTILPAAPSGDIIVTGRALPLTSEVRGQTATTVTDRDVRNTPATTIADIVKLSPGVAVIGGNGPRDVGVSIRGSNARQSFGARNIQVFEDDFPVTQPDGLARFDLTDPHAYGAVDVVRGPSSARYGNYALGGAVNFRTRRGRDIDGAEVGTDFGGDGYANAFATIGDAGDRYEYALFGSVVGGKGATGHTNYDTETVNALGTYAVDADDRVTAKFIHNRGEFRLSTRLSLNQYRLNPYQRGCGRAAAAAAGCGTISVLVNGVNGARVAQSAAEADLARDDKRTIAGLRWEHDFGAATTWRTQGTFDSRIVYQPTSATPFQGRYQSWNLSSDVTDRRTLAGMDATLFAGAFWNHLDLESTSFNKTPAGRRGLGAPTQEVEGDVENYGARARAELQAAPRLLLVTGVGAERSRIDIGQIAYAYPVGTAPRATPVDARRRFWNVAPEAALLWRATGAVSLRARVGAGYGIPQPTQLFVTPAGVAGANTDLKTQRNTGVDLGADLTLGDRLQAELTGYHEWFRNELVTQSAGVNLLAYTSNAPRSVHRGVEAGLDWRPFAGLPGARARVSYGYNDHRYTRFKERLTAGAASRVFDRDGNDIPGVVPHFLNLRAGYDQPGGLAEGLGGFVEYSYRSRYALDNANRLRVPGYSLVNLNIHWDPPRSAGWWSRVSLYASVQNLFDRTYVGSASVIAGSFDPATGAPSTAAQLGQVTGAIYAGQPRTVFAGLKTRF